MNEIKTAAKEEMIKKKLDGAHGERAPSVQEIREIMDAEMCKPLKEIDNALVDKCSQLLCALYECTEAANASEAAVDQSKRNLRARIDCNQQCKKWSTFFKQKYVLRTVVVTAACAVVIGVAGILIGPGMLKMHTSDNGEDYITHGQTPVVDVLPNANADRIIMDDIYSTNNLSDAFEYLGYKVDMPTRLPEDAIISEISISQNEVLDTLNVVYTIGNQKVLYLDVGIINDFDGITIAREQNQHGEETTLPSGKAVYVAQNIEKRWALYTKENTTYQATSGYYDLDTVLRLIDSIGE